MWTLTEKWILRQAVRPFITDEMYIRKKAPFNPPPQPASSSSGRSPLQVRLRERITRESVERLGFVNWPYIEEGLEGYLRNPAFPAQGAIDSRARMLMGVWSFVVLQERFGVPQFRV